MEKVWGTCVFEIGEYVCVQKGKAIRETEVTREKGGDGNSQSRVPEEA